MFKFLFFLIFAIAQISLAEPKLICTSTGNMKGSYYIDITGYESLLLGTARTLNKELGFKPFRSWVEKISDVICALPNHYLEGPDKIIACYGQGRNRYETALSKGPGGLTMTIRGPNIPAGYTVPCEIKNF